MVADLPGVRKEDIKVRLQDDNTLSISAERSNEREKKDDERQMHISERVFGRISRSIKLPPSADTENVAANYEDGVLKLVVPRRSASTGPREISIE